MDVFVYDSNFRGLEIIDSYKSMLWTERYSSSSECEFDVPDSSLARRVLREGNFLSIADSDEFIQIDTFDAEDKIIKVTGSSLDDIFNHRFVQPSWNTQYGSLTVAGFPYDIPRYLVNDFAANPAGIMGSGIVTDATNGPYEIIPNLEVPAANIENSFDWTSTTLSVPIGTLYDSVKNVCDAFGLGFKLVPVDITETSYRLVFKVYEGRNRTSLQTVNEVVQFNSALDTLTNTKEFRSVKGYKNVAWAYASNISYTAPLVGRAFATPADRVKTGFERRVLRVDVTDIQASDVNLTTSAGRTAFVALLNQRAASALANNNYVRLVDGELVPQEDYQYKVHYSLGDILELTIDTGDSSYARVTEYIYSQDDTGFSSYPTLSTIS